MRIIGNIPHPVLKITIFSHDNKYIVQFEAGLYNQSYIFRTGEIVESLEDLKKIIDPPFLEEVKQSLNQMHQIKTNALARKANEAAEGFDDII